MPDRVAGYRPTIELSDDDLRLRQKSVGLEPEDARRLATLKNLIHQHVDDYVAAFFDYFSEFPQSAGAEPRQQLLAEARKLKHDHVLAIAGGDYGRSYVEQRLRLGELYGEMGLDARQF